MPLLSFQGVAVEYGATEIFREVTLALETRRRVGLVGPNGAGKSTLLRLASGELLPSAGKVERRRGLRLGLLAQLDADYEHSNVLDQALIARRDLLDLRHQLHDLEARLAAGDHADAILHEYGEAQARYEHGGGYTLEARAREILGGLGFLDDALDQDPNELSGGWRRRLQLAQLLMVEADVFLLDEPTNHLDVTSIEWLEDFLRLAPQAMLIVSHDRRFLDNVVDATVELEAGRSYTYPGNYSKFMELREARRREQTRQYESQRDYIAHQEAFIQRYKAGQRAREARGRATRLQRMERIEPPPDDRAIRMRFGGQPATAAPLQSKGLRIGYDESTPLLEVPTFAIEAGERVAVVGANGSGKTTLLRTLEGSLRPLGGSVGYGARVQRSYYDQFLGDLPQDKNLIEVLQAAHNIPEESARSHLARLLFRGDDVLKKVRQLSGGERSRLAIARLMLDQGNLLFLDEPTNHLDLPSQEVLQDALIEFAGTIVFVTHDRELIDRLATHTWWIAGGYVDIEAGGYRDHKQAPASSTGQQSHSAPLLEDGREHRRGREARAEAAAERKAAAEFTRRLAQVEKQLADAEARLQAIDARLGDPDLYRFPMEAEILGRERTALAATIAKLYMQWEEMQSQAEPQVPAGPT